MEPDQIETLIEGCLNEEKSSHSKIDDSYYKEIVFPAIKALSRLKGYLQNEELMKRYESMLNGSKIVLGIISNMERLASKAGGHEYSTTNQFSRAQALFRREFNSSQKEQIQRLKEQKKAEYERLKTTKRNQSLMRF